MAKWLVNMAKLSLEYSGSMSILDSLFSSIEISVFFMGGIENFWRHIYWPRTTSNQPLLFRIWRVVGLNFPLRYVKRTCLKSRRWFYTAIFSANVLNFIDSCTEYVPVLTYTLSSGSPLSIHTTCDGPSIASCPVTLLTRVLDHTATVIRRACISIVNGIGWNHILDWIQAVTYEEKKIRDMIENI